jgi:hypothetical protein
MRGGLLELNISTACFLIAEWLCGLTKKKLPPNLRQEANLRLRQIRQYPNSPLVYKYEID